MTLVEIFYLVGAALAFFGFRKNFKDLTMLQKVGLWLVYMSALVELILLIVALVVVIFHI